MFEYQTSIFRSRRATNKNIATKYSKSLVCRDQKVHARCLTVCKVLVATNFRVVFPIKDWWRSDLIFFSIDPGTKPNIDCHSVLIEDRITNPQEVCKETFQSTMDVNYHTNRFIAHRSTGSYFVGSPSRQYGSGIGSAIKLGLKSFVLPRAKKYGVPLAKSFIGEAAPELPKVLEGSSKPKEEFRSAARTTIRKQVGGGRSGTFRNLCTSNTSSRRRVNLLQNIKKRTICKVSRPPSRNMSNRPKKTSRVKRTVDAKVQKRLFHEKENQLQPIVAHHEKLQAKSVAALIFSLKSLTQQRDIF